MQRLLAAIASGLLLAASFPRIDQAWLAWLALVPLLLAIRGASPRAAAGYGWTTGFVFFLLTVYWIPDTISNFTTISPLLAKLILVLLAAVAANSHALFAWALEALARGGVSRVLAMPAVWVVVEWTREFFPAEFPWNLLGYSQMAYHPMPQIADIGGVYLVSAAIVLTNAALAELVAARAGRKGAVRTSTQLLLAVLPPLVLAGYGQWRLAELRTIAYTGSLRVGIAQGNIAQDQKWDEALRDHILSRYVALTEQAADAGAQLVVWPEAALPFYLRQDMRSLELVRMARERNIDLLVGAPGYEDLDGSGPKPWNQAWLVRADGSVQGPYNKIQLVPFGEYIPLYGLFGMVDIAVEAVGQFGRGSEHTIFETKNLARIDKSPAPVAASRPARFATLICYEGIFPSLTRQFAAAGADFLVNISNDAWYGDTAAPQQHLAMAAMRAIENRRPLVRSTNTGISAFVTDEGLIGPTTPLFHEDMVVETVLTRDAYSFYRIHGDLFRHLCEALVAVLASLVLIRRASRETLGGSWRSSSPKSARE